MVLWENEYLWAYFYSSPLFSGAERDFVYDFFFIGRILVEENHVVPKKLHIAIENAKMGNGYEIRNNSMTGVNSRWKTWI